MTIAWNDLPKPGLEFPQEWVAQFRQELNASGLRRVGIVTTTLLVIETLLLISDFYRTQWLAEGLDGLVVWRLATLFFLLSYRFYLQHVLPEPLRLRYFLATGMLMCCWVSAVMAGVSGDLSTYTIGALGVAAACPLPGRFNASLFLISGSSLILWLFAAFSDLGLFWASNLVATCVMGMVVERFTFDAALRDFTNRKSVERQRERADELLYNVFPESVAAALKQGQRSIALHGEVTILFADIVGFTSLSGRMLPSQLLSLLENIFGRFDALARQHGVEKIKTIGDAYMAIAGAPVPVDHQVERMAEFALDIVATCREISAADDYEIAVRVGIHTGPVVAGVIGSSRLCYDLWGDSVNTAQRIESQGAPNAISVSEPVYFRLRHRFVLEDRGLVELKGKGATRTFALTGRR